MIPDLSKCRFDHTTHYILKKRVQTKICQSKITEEANAVARC